MVTYCKQVMYITIISFTFTPAYARSEKLSSENSPPLEIKDSIAQFVEKSQMECAYIIYELVSSALSGMTKRRGKSLYQSVDYVFSSGQMKKVIRFGKAYGSVAKLYETAADIAYQKQDIEAVIVLHIAAENARIPWYKRYAFVLGGVVGAIGASSCQLIKVMGNS